MGTMPGRRGDNQACIGPRIREPFQSEQGRGGQAAVLSVQFSHLSSDGRNVLFNATLPQGHDSEPSSGDEAALVAMLKSHPLLREIVTSYVRFLAVGAPPEVRESMLQRALVEVYQDAQVPLQGGSLAGCHDRAIEQYLAHCVRFLQEQTLAMEKLFEEATACSANLASAVKDSLSASAAACNPGHNTQHVQCLSTVKEESMYPQEGVPKPLGTVVLAKEETSGDSEGDEGEEHGKMVLFSGHPRNQGEGNMADEFNDLLLDSEDGGPLNLEAAEKMLKAQFKDFFLGLSAECYEKKQKHKLPPSATGILHAWWKEHEFSPYPSEAEKAELEKATGLTMKQLNNWFVNKRKRQWRQNS